MTTDQYAPLLRTGSSRHSTTHPHQPIDAHYYNITDIESWPIAGLLVMLDGQQQPVRAELHVDAGLDPHVQETAVRQARVVLQEHYIGGDPVALRIVETDQLREAVEVRLPPLGARPKTARRMTWRTYGAGIAAVGLVALVIWGIFALAPSSGSGSGAASMPPAENGTTNVEAAAGDLTPEENRQAVADGETAVGPDDDELSEMSEIADAGAPDEADVGVSDLPPSRNARDDLGIGVRVEIVPGLQLALRSEPGADAGEVIGSMSSGTEATIVGGPRLTPGTSDTIVWWLLRLDGGVEAWAAANTSEQTLLVPAE